nr:U32 family peptidase [Lachnoanaerobaculum saburreum]
MMKITELLAPAGSYESLVAAVNAGADAVYIGGKKFSARAYADNPDEDILIKGIEYAHTFGVNIYMTINTLFKESEMNELFDYIKTYYNAGIDAVIVQDLGVFEFIRKHFKKLPIHASTQMTVTGSYGAIFLKNIGASRIVPAREISLAEIKDIDNKCDIEIECFVHGALCYSYSGQCLMSSIIGGRSGNRGRCAQTCRLPYDLYEDGKKLNKSDERNLLSCKDLCSLDILPDLIEAGIDSLKIEGRMKSPRYTAGVVGIWRKYLDLYNDKKRTGYKVDKADRKLLLDLFDRGGQTEGYYKRHNGRDMIAIHEKPANRDVNTDYFNYLDKTFVEGRRAVSVFGKIKIKKDMPIVFDIAVKDLRQTYGRESQVNSISVKVFGESPQPAKTRASSVTDVEKQLKKTGNTFFSFERLDIEMDGDLFIPVKVLNELRREAIDKLYQKILDRYRRDDSGVIAYTGFIYPGVAAKTESKSRVKFNILCETMEQVDAVLDFARSTDFIFDEISIESELISEPETEKKIKAVKDCAGICNLYMPHIFRDEAKSFFDKHLQTIKDCKFDNFIVRSLEEIFYIDDKIDNNANIILDYSVYAYNKNTIDFYNDKFNIRRLTYPLELNLSEIRQLDNPSNEMIAYGKIPMMVSAQCLKKTAKGCDHKKEILVLKDRKNSEMQVKTHCDFCYNTILNSKPLSILGMENEVKKISPGILRLWFTTENASETKTVLRKYIDNFYNNVTVSNIDDFTRGHLKRGIE